MEYSLSLTARGQDELFERVLRVTRHRGFRVQSMELSQHGSGYEQQQHIALRVSSERPIHLLRSQLEKLVDVQQVELNATHSAASAKA
ncbi:MULTISPECIES: acetolactate synthase 2 small subunit [Aliagarivorans]|uniref:acetolactate synthase 2 small subunit n=1 Tax=Aliagarivorans TaxID=882379 RepID=UPI00047D6C28|nr:MULTISPECIES: acetolactate synthase 2 small subunit [Aliagarivorans]